MKTEERSRHTVWMEDTVWQRVQEHYKRDGCSTQNEFIAKAILFYCGYLQSEYAGDFLPKILGETLEAILSMFGDRIGKLLLKQAVEQNICNHILASDTDIDAATYQKMRGMGIFEDRDLCIRAYLCRSDRASLSTQAAHRPYSFPRCASARRCLG